jgi:hypothetical protein
MTARQIKQRRKYGPAAQRRALCRTLTNCILTGDRAGRIAAFRAFQRLA